MIIDGYKVVFNDGKSNKRYLLGSAQNLAEANTIANTMEAMVGHPNWSYVPKTARKNGSFLIEVNLVAEPKPETEGKKNGK